jgi:alpha-N-arabinofuranosidase
MKGVAMNTRQLTSPLTCILTILTAGAWALHAAPPASAATTAPTAVNAIVDAGKTFAPINPNLYGMFIEHAGGLVYRGMWAEILDDRKFYYPITAQGADAAGQPAARGDRGSRFGGAPRRWTPVGPAESITMDAQHAYVGDHSPAIVLSSNEPRGIRQAGLALMRDKAYTGRIVLAGDPAAQVTVSLIWGTDVTDRQSITINKLTSAFVKFPLTFKSPSDSTDAHLKSPPPAPAPCASASSR